MHYATLSVLLFSTAAMGGDWLTLFDGTSLDGWRAAENPKAFTVKDETLVVNGERGHLFWSGKDGQDRKWDDFEFEAMVRTQPGANSGVFFHTKFQKSGWPDVGYECQVNATHGDSIKTCSLYGIVNNNMPPHVDGDWVKLRIRVAGRHIQTSIDNQVVIDWWEPKDRKGSKKLSTGTFAIQAHDPKSVVEYKFIKARHLDPKDMTRAERLDVRLSSEDFPEKEWWNRMDHGPFVSCATGYPMDYATANKGLNLFLENGWVASFDTGLLRVGAVWQGGLDWEGVSYNGSHGGHPGAVGTPIYGSLEGPGWKVNGSWEDPRPSKPWGPLPAEMARWGGLMRVGEESILNYTVGQARVLEHHGVEQSEAGNVLVRTLEVFPAATPESMHVRVADATRDQRIKVLSDGRGARVGDTRFAIRGSNGSTFEISGTSLVLNLDPTVDGPSGSIMVAIAATRDGIKPSVLASAPPPKRLFTRMFAGSKPDPALFPAIYPEEIIVQANVAENGDETFVVDDIPVPFENPWNSYMRIGGFDFVDEDTAAVCTWNGDVWLVEGLREMGEIRWKRFASGLFETLGLAVRDGQIFVHGKDQITRLIDFNDDGEADLYDNFCNLVNTTPSFHDFAFDLQVDGEGNFWFGKAGPVRGGGRGFEDSLNEHHGTVIKVDKTGRDLEVFSTGLRAPNGIGISPDGQVVTAGDNEGTWVPHCKLHWMSQGSFQGVVPLAHRSETPTDYNKPLCWFPMSVDNSSGGQTWVTSSKWPWTGELLHLSYGQSSIYRVMKEEVNGQVQGGVFRVPVQLGSSAMRGRFHPTDGQLWVCGLKGWQTNAARLAAFQRVRWTGRTPKNPTSITAVEDGIKISFSVKLDQELAEDTGSWAVNCWDYVWGPMYGSPEVSALNPDVEQIELAKKKEIRVEEHDEMVVESATLLDDGKTVHLKLKNMQPVMQMHVQCDLESTDGDVIITDIWNTIHELGTN